MVIKFDIEYTGSVEDRKLLYDIEEYSFDTEPSVSETDFDIIINKLNLTVIDNGKVIQVWGFSGCNEWIKSDYLVPESRKGILKVIDDLEGGLSYRVGNDDIAIHVNTKTGWVCIGDPEKTGYAVEFINNCIAVIDGEQEFVSLWLKPDRLPKL